MFAKISPATALMLLSILDSVATAFNFTTYGTPQCTGLSVIEVTDIAKGCMETKGSGVSAIISRWTSEADNNLLIALYSDNTCCHANVLDTVVWTAGCSEVPAGVHSWRVLDPNDPDKGKEGDNYTC